LLCTFSSVIKSGWLCYGTKLVKGGETPKRLHGRDFSDTGECR
jgi:hypothetical protein